MTELTKGNETGDDQRVHIPWSIIRSNVHDRDTIIDTLTDDDAWPFLGLDIDAIYEFFKDYIRPAQDSTRSEPFTNFVFIAVDEDCIKSETYECLLCCDAPDYSNENGEVVLQVQRMPINVAKMLLVPLEQLAMTPSEALDVDSDILSSIPPFTQDQLPGSKVGTDDDDRQQVVSPAEARINKQRGLALGPNDDEERGLDNDRMAVIFRTNREEAIRAAYLYRQAELLCRRTGKTLKFHDSTDPMNN